MNAKEMLQLIVDVFSGADGCVELIEFRLMLERMEQRAADGDSSAARVMLVVEQFCRLVKSATGRTL